MIKKKILKCKLKYHLNIHKPYVILTKILKYIHNPCILAFKAETSVHESWYIWVRRISKSIFSFVNFVRPLHIFDIVIAREPNHEWGTCFFRGEKTEDEDACEFEFESLSWDMKGKFKGKGGRSHLSFLIPPHF